MGGWVGGLVVGCVDDEWMDGWTDNHIPTKNVLIVGYITNILWFHVFHV